MGTARSTNLTITYTYLHIKIVQCFIFHFYFRYMNISILFKTFSFFQGLPRGLLVDRYERGSCMYQQFYKSHHFRYQDNHTPFDGAESGIFKFRTTVKLVSSYLACSQHAAASRRPMPTKWKYCKWMNEWMPVTVTSIYLFEDIRWSLALWMNECEWMDMMSEWVIRTRLIRSLACLLGHRSSGVIMNYLSSVRAMPSR